MRNRLQSAYYLNSMFWPDASELGWAANEDVKCSVRCCGSWKTLLFLYAKRTPLPVRIWIGTSVLSFTFHKTLPIQYRHYHYLFRRGASIREQMFVLFDKFEEFSRFIRFGVSYLLFSMRYNLVSVLVHVTPCLGGGYPRGSWRGLLMSGGENKPTFKGDTASLWMSHSCCLQPSNTHAYTHNKQTYSHLYIAIHL